jgi:hypothetical protein
VRGSIELVLLAARLARWLSRGRSRHSSLDLLAGPLVFEDEAMRQGRGGEETRRRKNKSPAPPLSPLLPCPLLRRSRRFHPAILAHPFGHHQRQPEYDGGGNRADDPGFGA